MVSGGATQRFARGGAARPERKSACTFGNGKVGCHKRSDSILSPHGLPCGESTDRRYSCACVPCGVARDAFCTPHASNAGASDRENTHRALGIIWPLCV